jgi:hypothetical protein
MAILAQRIVVRRMVLVVRTFLAMTVRRAMAVNVTTAIANRRATII